MAPSREDFERWLLTQEERLAKLAEFLPPFVFRKLDHSLGSLDILEIWLLKKYAGSKPILKKSEQAVLDGVATYVGEILRKQTDSQWSIVLDNPKDAYFQLPVIEKKNDWIECPISMVTSALDRRTGNYLAQVIRAYMESE